MHLFDQFMIQRTGSCVVVIQYLSLWPICVLCYSALKYKHIHVYFHACGVIGKKALTILSRFGLLTFNEKPVDNPWLLGSAGSLLFKNELMSLRSVQKYKSGISSVLRDVFKKENNNVIDQLNASSVKYLSLRLRNVNCMCGAAKYYSDMRRSDVDNKLMVITDVKVDRKYLACGSCNEVMVVQPIFGDEVVLALKAIYFAIRALVRRTHTLLFFARNKDKERGFRYGVTAVWGIESGKDRVFNDDLFYVRHGGLGYEKVVYIFEREQCKPNRDNIHLLDKIGASYVGLENGILKGYEHIKYDQNYENFWGIVSRLYDVSRIAAGYLNPFNEYRYLYPIWAWLYSRSKDRANLYRHYSLGVMTHPQEASYDPITLACEFSGAIRVGIHWSCFDGPCETTLRTHHVYFVWGRHDAIVCKDSDSVSKFIIVAGCPLLDDKNYAGEEVARVAEKSVRESGAEVVLAVFDASFHAEEYYRYFLEWLINDKSVGIMIKSKGGRWGNIEKDGLGGLVKQAYSTGRLKVLDTRLLPSDVAPFCDFVVGVATLSVVVLSALRGARVLYLDYEKLNEGICKPYATLHKLGDNQCVFHSLKDIKESVLQYMQDKDSIVNLGNAGSLLDEFDPYRDGKAGYRIAEFISWYESHIEIGESSESSIKYAAECYAKKWGEDKVFSNSADIFS